MDATDNASTRRSTGIGLIFALPALLIGLWSFKMLFWDFIWTAKQAQRWPQIQATVVKVDWKYMSTRSAGVFGREQQIVVQYEYVFQSAHHTGNKVGLESFAARDRTLYEHLRSVKLHHGTVDARVDPDDPDRTVLDTHIRILAVVVYMLVSCFFTGIGYGLLVAMGRARPY